MSDLKCEYPEGCKLDLWIKVVKAKYIDQVSVLRDCFCILESEVGGIITRVEDIRIRVLNTSYSFNFNSVSIWMKYKVVVVVLVDDEEEVVTITNTYEKTIKLDQFDPPLTINEFRSEVDEAEVIVQNWLPDWHIKGKCADLCDAGSFSPIPGTLIEIDLSACIIVKLSKMHDIIVYGELDPECY